MTEKQDMGVVTQSDREAAVDIYNVILHDWHTQHMLDGMEDECYVIQAFKKHRLASQAEQRACPVQFATVRDGGDEWHIECRFKDGQKFAAVTVDKDQEALADWIAKALATPARTDDAGVGGERIERAAQWLHDEGGFDDAWPDRTWPEHPGDTGQRDGGFVKIVPSDVQAKFRDVATRMLRVFPAALSPAPDRVEALREAVQRAHDTLIELNPNNYSHDEVCAANEAAIEAILLLAEPLGERHGKSEEWWHTRRATHPQPSQKGPSQ